MSPALSLSLSLVACVVSFLVRVGEEMSKLIFRVRLCIDIDSASKPSKATQNGFGR